MIRTCGLYFLHRFVRYVIFSSAEKVKTSHVTSCGRTVIPSCVKIKEDVEFENELNDFIHETLHRFLPHRPDVINIFRTWFPGNRTKLNPFVCHWLHKITTY